MNKTLMKKKTIHRLKLIQSVNQKPIELEKPKFDLTGIGLTGNNGPLGQALSAYLNSDIKQARFRNWFIDGNTLYYRCTDNSLHIPTLIEHVIATKVNHDGKTLIVGNSSILSHVDRKGHKLNRGESEVQRILKTRIPMLPFSVFEQAKLDVQKLSIVDQAKEETLQIKTPNPKYRSYDDKNTEPKFIMVPRHFTGASLFKIGREYFLFDVDRREIEHGLFNAFLVNLPKPAKTIAEAYDSLKPQAVKDAEAQGLEVLRQGEFFFIPVDTKTIELIGPVEPAELDSITLSAGPNRPNYAHGIELKDGKRLKRRELDWDARRSVKSDATYLTGEVTHSGREHEPIQLKTWYTAVPNTAQKSFTITGDVD